MHLAHNNHIFSHINPCSMKKIILLAFFLFVFTGGSVWASHLMGGEVTARHLSGNDYEVTMTVYRDTLGISMSTVAYFDVLDSNGIVISNFSTPFNSVVSGILIPGYPYGVEMYVFIDTISFIGNGVFSVQYYDCCRNASIINMSNPSSESMILSTTISNLISGNSTPVFLAPPVFFVQVNTPWTYNPLPYDIDGDSLSWSLDIPLSQNGVPVIGYALPYADSTGPFVISNITGEISWTPNFLGNFATSVLVEEYRNGVKIGEIRRDMQMIVVADTSQIAKIRNFNTFSLNNQGIPYVKIQPNQSYQVTLFASDPNPMETVRFEAYGEPFQFSTHAADFNVSSKKLGDNEKTGEFTWNPSPSMARTEPYIVAFRVGDDYFTNDYTVLFQVEEPLSVQTFNYFSIGNIYPNPASSNLFLSVSLDKETKISIRILDLLGNEKLIVPATDYNEGKHLISAVINLANGQYIAQILKNDVVCKTQKFLVVK